jgi:hypothetical protein
MPKSKQEPSDHNIALSILNQRLEALELVCEGLADDNTDKTLSNGDNDSSKTSSTGGGGFVPATQRVHDLLGATSNLIRTHPELDALVSNFDRTYL